MMKLENFPKRSWDVSDPLSSSEGDTTQHNTTQSLGNKSMLNGDHGPANCVRSEAGTWAQEDDRQLPTSSLIQNPILGQKPRSSRFGAMLWKGGCHWVGG